jgi:hypothetical protein
VTDDGRNETEAKRADRNLTEMLQGLRTITIGVQVVFAFLLTIAFSAGRESLSQTDRVLYLCVLSATGLAAAFLAAPAAHHRILFRQGRKAKFVVVANRLVLIGMVLAVLALSGAVALVGHVLYGSAVAAGLGIGSATAFTVIWFVIPLLMLRRPSR